MYIVRRWIASGTGVTHWVKMMIMKEAGSDRFDTQKSTNVACLCSCISFVFLHVRSNPQAQCFFSRCSTRFLAFALICSFPCRARCHGLSTAVMTTRLFFELFTILSGKHDRVLLAPLLHLLPSIYSHNGSLLFARWGLVQLVKRNDRVMSMFGPQSMPFIPPSGRGEPLGSSCHAHITDTGRNRRRQRRRFGCHAPVKRGSSFREGRARV